MFNVLTGRGMERLCRSFKQYSHYEKINIGNLKHSLTHEHSLSPELNDCLSFFNSTSVKEKNSLREHLIES